MQRIIIVVAAVIFVAAGLLAGMSYKRLFPSPSQEPPSTTVQPADKAGEEKPVAAAKAPDQPQEEKAPEPKAAAMPTADKEGPPVEVMEELIETQFQEIEKLKSQLAEFQAQAGSGADRGGNASGAREETRKQGPEPIVYPGSELFTPGQVRLSDKGNELLKELAQKILAQEKYNLMICGHTDDSNLGPAKARVYGDNLGLSVARALEVARGLSSLGVPMEMIGVCGHGDSRPQAPNDNPSNMAKNRRVVISFLPISEN